MASFLDNRYCGRPLLLILIWTFALVGFFTLWLGMFVDELTRVSYTVNSAEYTVVCQSSQFDTDPGALNEKYSDAEGDSGTFSEPILQKQAGSAWLAFGILSMICSPLLLFGVVTDWYLGRLDAKKPVDYWSGYCIKSMGFTRLTAITMIILQLLQLIIFGVADHCKELVEERVINASDISTIGGASIAMVVLSLIFLSAIFILILVYQFRVSAELPTGEAKEPPIKIPKRTKKEEAKPKEEEKPTPAGQAGKAKAPNTGYFKPTRDVTPSGNNGDAVEVVTKPSAPPPKPQPKPAGPPPNPSAKPSGPPPVPK